MDRLIRLPFATSPGAPERLALFPGRHLGEDEFARMQAYMEQRADGVLAGVLHGIVYGLEVDAPSLRGDSLSSHVTIKPGLALGRDGQAIALRTPLRLPWGELHAAVQREVDGTMQELWEPVAQGGLYLLVLQRQVLGSEPAGPSETCRRTEPDPTRDLRIEQVLRPVLRPVTATGVPLSERLRCANRFCLRELDRPLIGDERAEAALALVAVDLAADGSPRFAWCERAAGRRLANSRAGHYALLDQCGLALRELVGRNARRPAVVNADGTVQQAAETMLAWAQRLTGLIAGSLEGLPAAIQLPPVLLSALLPGLLDDYEASTPRRDSAGRVVSRFQFLHSPGIAVDAIPLRASQVQETLRREIGRGPILLGAGRDRIRLTIAVPDREFRPDLLDKPVPDADVLEGLHVQYVKAYRAWLWWREAQRELVGDPAVDHIQSYTGVTEFAAAVATSVNGVVTSRVEPVSGKMLNISVQPPRKLKELGLPGAEALTEPVIPVTSFQKLVDAEIADRGLQPAVRPLPGQPVPTLEQMYPTLPEPYRSPVPAPWHQLGTPVAGAPAAAPEAGWLPHRQVVLPSFVANGDVDRDGDGIADGPIRGSAVQRVQLERWIGILEDELLDDQKDLDELRDYILTQRQHLDAQTLNLAALAGGVATDGSGLRLLRNLPYVKLDKPVLTAQAQQEVLEQARNLVQQLDMGTDDDAGSLRNGDELQLWFKQSLTRQRAAATVGRHVEAAAKALLEKTVLAADATRSDRPMIGSLMAMMPSANQQMSRAELREGLLRRLADGDLFDGVSGAGIQPMRTVAPDLGRLSSGGTGMVTQVVGGDLRRAGQGPLAIEAGFAQVNQPAFTAKVADFGVLGHVRPDVYTLESAKAGVAALRDRFRDRVKKDAPVHVEPQPEAGQSDDDIRYTKLVELGRHLTELIREAEQRRLALEQQIQSKEKEVGLRREELAATRIAEGSHRAMLKRAHAGLVEALDDYAMAQRMLAEDWTAVEAWDERRRAILDKPVALLALRVRQEPIAMELPDPLPLRPGRHGETAPGCGLVEGPLARRFDLDVALRALPVDNIGREQVRRILERELIAVRGIAAVAATRGPGSGAEAAQSLHPLPDELEPFLEAIWELPARDLVALRPLLPELPPRRKVLELVAGRAARLAVRIAAPVPSMSRLSGLYRAQGDLLRRLAAVPTAVVASERLVRQEAATVLGLADLLAAPAGILRSAAERLRANLERAAGCLAAQLAATPAGVRLAWGQLADDDRLPCSQPERWPNLHKLEATAFNTARTLVEIVQWWFRQLDGASGDAARDAFHRLVRAAVLEAAHGDSAQLVQGHVEQVATLRPGLSLRVSLNRMAALGSRLQLYDERNQPAGVLRVEDHDERGALVSVIEMAPQPASAAPRLVTTAFTISGRLGAR